MDRGMDRSDGALATSACANRLPRWMVAALCVPPAVLLLAFYVIPVVSLATRFVSGSVLLRVAQDHAIQRVLWFTTWQALASTMCTVVVGLVPAYVLARFQFRGRRFIAALITVPFVLPTIVVGSAFLALLPQRLDHSVAAILLAHVFFNVAVVVRGVGAMWEQLPADLGRAASTLGASPWQVMRTITLPLLSPAIVAASSVTFLFSFTSFGVVRLLGGPLDRRWRWKSGNVPPAWATFQPRQHCRYANSSFLLLQWCVLVASNGEHRRGLKLQPTSQRQVPRTRAQRILVGAVATLTTTAVLTPILALFERSVRSRDGYSLTAWRSLFGHSAQSTRPTPTTIDPLNALTNSLKFAIVAVVISVVIGACASIAVVAVGATAGFSTPG